jgi:alanine dehydrogenase
LKIGVPRETKEGERRVALLPEHVSVLAREGRDVRVERTAGAGVGADDDAYAAAGAHIVAANAAWDCELIVKVKEIQAAEVDRAQPGRTLFGYQHLAGEPGMTRALARRGATAIAFELVRGADAGFPLLAPMSAIAGRMAIEAAQRILGKAPAEVLVLGAGHAGLAAAQAAHGSGSRVTVLTRSEASRAAAAARLGPDVACGIATAEAIERAALRADAVVGAVFVAGAATPKLLPRTLVRRMKRGAVILDVSIDAGGVAETSRPTTHGEPTFVEEGVIHYCVANIPAADPAASAAALGNAALPYVRALAGLGIEAALRASAGLAAGLVLWRGGVSHRGIAEEAGLPYTPVFAPPAP